MDNNEDDNDHEMEDLDDFEEHGDIDSPEFPEGGEDELHPRQGVPLSSNGTISSSSVTHFSRPFLPRFLLKIKDVLFGSHHHEDHGDVLPNYRRLPIISGSLIPFSILLEIPALTEHWYVQTSNGEVVQELSNPPLVTVAMSLSMALAVVANIALIFRFLERNIMRSTILCIVTLTLHGDILFISVPLLHHIDSLSQIY
jgi:potassium channel subfamily K